MSGDDDIDKAFEELISQVDFSGVDDDGEDNDSDNAGGRSAGEPEGGDRLAQLFGTPGWSEAPQPSAASAADHFVPPDPPPGPPVEPRRRLAWSGLLGAPLVMLAAVVFGFGLPTWVLVALVVCFVGGFVYLVGTMAGGPHDPWSGDDGAVV